MGVSSRNQRLLCVYSLSLALCIWGLDSVYARASAPADLAATPLQNANCIQLHPRRGVGTHGPGLHDYPPFIADRSAFLTEPGAVQGEVVPQVRLYEHSAGSPAGTGNRLNAGTWIRELRRASDSEHVVTRHRAGRQAPGRSVGGSQATTGYPASVMQRFVAMMGCVSALDSRR